MNHTITLNDEEAMVVLQSLNIVARDVRIRDRDVYVLGKVCGRLYRQTTDDFVKGAMNEQWEEDSKC